MMPGYKWWVPDNAVPHNKLEGRASSGEEQILGLARIFTCGKILLSGCQLYSLGVVTNSLGLAFLICKMGIVTVIPQGHYFTPTGNGHKPQYPMSPHLCTHLVWPIPLPPGELFLIVFRTRLKQYILWEQFPTTP